MGRHARYYDIRTQAVLAWLALLLVGGLCWLTRPSVLHEPGDGMTPSVDLAPVTPRWPRFDVDAFGATEGYARWLHVENQSPVVREEARA